MEESILRRLGQCIDLGSRALNRVFDASPWFTSPWFGIWAALTTFVTLTVLPGAFGFSGKEALPFVGILAAAGTVAGLFLRNRLRTAVEGEQWRLPLLGIGAAFVTVELITLVIVRCLVVVQPEPSSFGFFLTALVMAPLVCLPLILFGGTLSGLTLWGVAWLLGWRSMPPCNIVTTNERSFLPEARTSDP